MKKLVKFTTREVVKEVEAEIELPAYFCMGDSLPSEAKYGDYFSKMVRITDAEKRGASISATHMIFSSAPSMYTRSSIYEFCRSCHDNTEVVQKWTQVPESEWLAAVALLKADIDGKEVEGE